LSLLLLLVPPPPSPILSSSLLFFHLQYFITVSIHQNNYKPTFILRRYSPTVSQRLARSQPRIIVVDAFLC
jgi:hypothetical protein